MTFWLKHKQGGKFYPALAQPLGPLLVLEYVMPLEKKLQDLLDEETLHANVGTWLLTVGLHNCRRLGARVNSVDDVQANIINPIKKQKPAKTHPTAN